MFASCPNEFDGCRNETSFSVMAGSNATFDAAVSFSPGGGCSYEQNITRKASRTVLTMSFTTVTLSMVDTIDHSD